MKAAPVAYHRASSLAEALALAAGHENAKYMAGGQTLLPMMNLRMATPAHVIDLSHLAVLRESRAEGEGLLIGAGTTHAMIEDGKVEDPTRGFLRHVAAGIAYRSVRNRGTVGGSLAHADPAADWPTALRALDAVAVIEGPGGERRVPMEAFQVGLMETCLAEGEILKGVVVPRLSARARWAYLKFCRKVGEFAHSIGVVVVDPAIGLANVVVGAAGGRPVRLGRVSASLAAASEELVRDDLARAAELDPSSYEFQVHKTMVRRAIAEALGK